MLGSLIRLAVFVALVVGVTWGVTRLMAMEGGATIVLAGQEYALSPLAFAGLLLAGAIALVAAFRLLDFAVALLLFILGDPAAVRRFTERPRQRRALDSLSQALLAIAGGDRRHVLTRAAQAQRLVDRPAITRLLGAQASEAAGDTRRARRYWRALAEEPETAVVGLRGLLAQAQAAGETALARELAERAVEHRPTDPELLATLVGLQEETGDPRAARATLTTARRIGAVARPDADRREARLALAMGEEAELSGDAPSARRLGLEAASLDPGNPEAVAFAARRLGAEGQIEAASRLVVDGWRRAPHAALARAYADLAPQESPPERRRRFERVFDANPAHRETRFLRAELALVARDWTAARAEIEGLREPELSARGCAIMAAVARGEGEPEAVVRAWLARALGAPREEGLDREIGHAAMLTLLVDDDLDAQQDLWRAPSPGSRSADRTGTRHGEAADSGARG